MNTKPGYMNQFNKAHAKEKVYDKIYGQHNITRLVNGVKPLPFKGKIFLNPNGQLISIASEQKLEKNYIHDKEPINNNQQRNQIQKEKKGLTTVKRPQSNKDKYNKFPDTNDKKNINIKNKTLIVAQPKEPKNTNYTKKYSYTKIEPQDSQKKQEIPLEEKSKPLEMKKYPTNKIITKKNKQKVIKKSVLLDKNELLQKKLSNEQKTPEKNDSADKSKESNEIISSSKKGNSISDFHTNSSLKTKGNNLINNPLFISNRLENSNETHVLRGTKKIELDRNVKPFISKFNSEVMENKEIESNNEAEIKSLREELDKLKKINLDNERKIREKTKKINEYLQNNSYKDKIIVNLKRQLEEQKKYINNISLKEEEIKELKEEIKKIKFDKDIIIESLNDKDKIIEEKTNEIKILKSKLKEVSEENEKKKKEKNELENEIKGKFKQELIKRNNILKKYEIILNEREKKIKNKELEINNKIRFFEDKEKTLEFEQNKLNSEQKRFSNIIQSLQEQIENLNKQKAELENKIKNMNKPIRNSNDFNFNKNNNMNNMMNNNMNNMMNNNMNSMMNNMMNNNMNNMMNNNMNNIMNNNLNNNMNFNIMNNLNNNMLKNNNLNLKNNMNNFNNNMNINFNNINMMNNFNNKNLINNHDIKINNNNINNQHNKRGGKNNQPKPPKPLNFYQKPTLIGLQNIGSTCFMNATLQCLSQTADLTNYFLDEKHSSNKIKNNNIALKNPNNLQLSPIYLELVEKLWDKNNYKGYFEPRRFMKTIEEMNPTFKLGEAGDSKDFIIFLLEQFHNELKKEDNNQSVDDNVNQYDKRSIFESFLKDFSKQTSIISDIFYGIQETTNVCLNCKNKYTMQNKAYPICYNYQIFNCLVFPLEEVRKMKNENNMRNNIIMGQNNIVTLDECFYYNQKTELFTGNNRSHCNICGQLADAHYTSRIYSCPNVLVLILNRGKNNIYDVKLNFTETIDITQFVSVKAGREIFTLYGVITHYGESGPSAHFLAFCKSPIDNKWYRYNDAVVTDVKNLQTDVIDFGNPYILFYKKEN